MAIFTRDDDSSAILNARLAARSCEDAQLPVQGTPHKASVSDEVLLVESRVGPFVPV
jgi:hypothetical protein